MNRLGKKIDTEVVNLPAEIFGRPKAPAGTWGSVVLFTARGGELLLVVGTAADTLISPRSCSSGYLRT